MENNLQKLSLSSEDDEVSNQKTEWFDLPYDIRYMIIGMMDNDTKLSYLLCSDACAADIPKNSLMLLNFSYLINTPFLTICFHGTLFPRKIYFKDNNHCIKVSCREIFKDDFSWEIEEEGCLSEVIAKYFRRASRNSFNLELMDIDANFPFNKANIKHFNQLKKLCISNYGESSKDIDLFECDFINPEQFYNISDKVDMSHVRLTTIQLAQMKSQFIVLESSEISSDYINQYLKLFVDGQLHENVRSVTLKKPDKNAWDLVTVLYELKMIKRFKADGDLEPFTADCLGSDVDEFAFALVSKKNNSRIATVRYCNSSNSIYIRIWSKNNSCDFDEYIHRADFLRDNNEFEIKNYLARNL